MSDLGTLGASAATVLAAFGAFLRWVWPKWRAFFAKVDAGLTSVIGHDVIRDPSNGRVIAAARPGIGVWMAGTDDTLSVLSSAVDRLVDQHTRIDDHERRIQHLEAGAAERIAARVDSTTAFGAIKAIAEAARSDDPDLED